MKAFVLQGFFRGGPEIVPGRIISQGLEAGVWLDGLEVFRNLQASARGLAFNGVLPHGLVGFGTHKKGSGGWHKHNVFVVTAARLAGVPGDFLFLDGPYYAGAVYGNVEKVDAAAGAFVVDQGVDIAFHKGDSGVLTGSYGHTVLPNVFGPDIGLRRGFLILYKLQRAVFFHPGAPKGAVVHLDKRHYGPGVLCGKGVLEFNLAGHGWEAL